MRLLKLGVPWHVAVSLSPTKRIAIMVAGGEIDGREFDWENTNWREP